MADWSIDKQAYLDEKPSLINNLWLRLTTDARVQGVLLALAVFVAALLPRILNLDTFITADEDDQIMFATHFLKSVLHGNFGGALVLGYPGVPTLILGAAGVGARYLAHYSGLYPLPWVTDDFFTTLDQVTVRFGQFDYPLDFITWVRVPMALTAALAILGIYLLVQRLAGRPVALLAALLLAFDPFILAHSRVIHVDAPLAYFMFLSFLAFLLYLENGAWKWLLLSGFFGGLAGLSKTPAAILGPILVVAGVIFALLPPPEQPRSVRWKRLVIALLVWGLIAVAAVFALWPSMWSRPASAIEFLYSNIQSVNQGAHPTTGHFWGSGETDQNPYYYLVVLPFHLTPLTTLGVLGGLAMLAAGGVSRLRGENSWAARILPLLLSLLVYSLIFASPVSAVSRRGDRYVLPIFFAVGLLSALALWWLAQWAARKLPGLMARLRLTPARLTGVLLAAQIFSVLLYHPYYLAYFNPIIAGPWTAPVTINVGWGEGMDVAARYLNQKYAANPADMPRVAAWYSNQFAPYYRGQTIDLSSQQAALSADATVFYINQVQRGFPSREILSYFRQREPEAVLSLGGVDYAWIYPGPVIGTTPQKNMTFPVEALLGDGKARLYGVDVGAVEFPADRYAVAPGENEFEDPYPGYRQTVRGLPVTLHWETLGSLNTNHGKINAFIRLVDENGNAWGQVDRLILAGLWRPIRWHPGFYLRDEYKLPIDPATPPGNYHLEVGLYDFETNLSYGVVKNIGELTLTAPENVTAPERLNVTRPLNRPVDESLSVVGHTFIDSALPPGGEITGKIYWQAGQIPERDVELEFSFVDQNRTKYIIAENVPFSPTYPVTDWPTGQIVGQAYRFRVPAEAPPGEYPMFVSVTNPATGEIIGQPVQLVTVTVQEHPRNFTLPDGVTPISAVINNEIELVGYKLHDPTVRARETFGLTLYWRSLEFAGGNYSVFVHAVGPDQSIRGQWDSVPAEGNSPTGGWLPGEIIEDHFEVLMSRDAPPWKYDIFVGMYDPVTGQRLPIFSAKAPTSDNRVWLTRVQGVEK